MDGPHPADPQPPTPADRRELAGRAGQLATALRDGPARLRVAADEPTRRVGFRLDDAVGLVPSAATALGSTAEDLARVRGRRLSAPDRP